MSAMSISGIGDGTDNDLIQEVDPIETGLGIANMDSGAGIDGTREQDAATEKDEDDDQEEVFAMLEREGMLTSTPMIRKPQFIARYEDRVQQDQPVITEATAKPSAENGSNNYLSKPLYTAKYLTKNNAGSTAGFDRSSASSSSSSSYSSQGSGYTGDGSGKSRKHDLASDKARIQRLTRQNLALRTDSAGSSYIPRAVTPDRPRSMYMGTQGALPSTLDRKPRLGSVHSRSPSYHGVSRRGSNASHTSLGSASHLLFQSYSPDISDETISPLARQLPGRRRNGNKIGAGGEGLHQLLSPSGSPQLDRSGNSFERRIRLNGSVERPSSRLSQPGHRRSSSDRPLSSQMTTVRQAPSPPDSLLDELDRSLQEEISRHMDDQQHDPAKAERQLEIVELDIQQTRKTYQKLKERFELQVKLRENLAHKAKLEGKFVSLESEGEEENEKDKKRAGDYKEAEKSPKNQQAQEGTKQRDGPHKQKPNAVEQRTELNTNPHRILNGIPAKLSIPNITIPRHGTERRLFFHITRFLVNILLASILVSILWLALNVIDYRICLKQMEHYRSLGLEGTVRLTRKEVPHVIDWISTYLLEY